MASVKSKPFRCNQTRRSVSAIRRVDRISQFTVSAESNPVRPGPIPAGAEDAEDTRERGARRLTPGAALRRIDAP